MTTPEQVSRMTTRIVNEALDIVRTEAAWREIASRVYSVPQEAAEAAKAARERLQAIGDSPEMPAVGWDQWTRPLHEEAWGCSSDTTARSR